MNERYRIVDYITDFKSQVANFYEKVCNLKNEVSDESMKCDSAITEQSNRSRPTHHHDVLYSDGDGATLEMAA